MDVPICLNEVPTCLKNVLDKGTGLDASGLRFFMYEKKDKEYLQEVIIRLQYTQIRDMHQKRNSTTDS